MTKIKKRNRQKKIRQRGGGPEVVPVNSAGEKEDRIAAEAEQAAAAAAAAAEAEAAPAAAAAAQKEIDTSQKNINEKKKWISKLFDKPYMWALGTWVGMAMLVAATGLPTWILYVSAMPFCFFALMNFTRSYRKQNDSSLESIGRLIFTSLPTLFLLYELSWATYLFVKYDDIINNHRKIPDNFNSFSLLLNGFLALQAVLISTFFESKKICDNFLGWAGLVGAIASSLACIHYIHIILTELITDDARLT